jgi:cell division protein FtsB
MKQTRRTLFAQNTQLQAQIAACGPDETMSRKQLKERLRNARKENESLTARVSALTAQSESLASVLEATKKELEATKKQKTAQPA